MRTISGVITVVQEDRFQLVDDQGVWRLFLLAHDAPVEAQDLPPLQASQARVTVRFEPAESLLSDIAHDVR